MKPCLTALTTVPFGVVTVIAAAPAVPGGATAVIDVAEFTVKLVAGIAAKSTAVAPDRPVPLIVTVAPPAAGPLAGLTVV